MLQVGTKVKVAALFGLAALLQGCAVSQAALTLAFDSPGKKNCLVRADPENWPVPTDELRRAKLKVLGGWLPVGKVAQFKFAYQGNSPGAPSWWHVVDYSQQPQDEPCTFTAPLSGTLLFSSGKQYQFEIPLESLPKEPVYGMFDLTLEQTQVQLVFQENRGETRVTLHAGKVWEFEPRKVLAVVPLSP